MPQKMRPTLPTEADPAEAKEPATDCWSLLLPFPHGIELPMSGKELEELSLKNHRIKECLFEYSLLLTYCGLAMTSLYCEKKYSLDM